MKINKVSNDEIIIILKYCLYSSTFLAQVESLKPQIIHPISNELIKHFIDICIEYGQTYGEAPGDAITTIINNRLKKRVSEEVLQGLLALADNVIYSEIQIPDDPDYGVDLLIKYTNREKLKQLVNSIEEFMTSIDTIPQALKRVEKFQPLTIEEPSNINLKDEKLITECFTMNKECLIPLGGKIGEIIRPHTYPASLIAFQGPEKSGKSWFLQYLAIQAAKRGRRVAIFEAGDMSKAQRICRLYSQLIKKPWLPNKKLEVARLPYASNILHDESSHELKIRISYKIAPILQESDVQKFLKSKEAQILDNIKLSVHVNSTLTVSQIQAILEKWSKSEKFDPHVIIIDYADILDTGTGKNEETRHKINRIWLDLRRLSQEWNACVVTATQADSKSYKKGTQTLENFSEDKRKYSHVTAMFALNRNNMERKGLVTRVSPLLIREGFIETNLEVACIGDPSKATPIMNSYYVKGPVEIIFSEDEKNDKDELSHPRKHHTSKKDTLSVEF